MKKAQQAGELRRATSIGVAGTGELVHPAARITERLWDIVDIANLVGEAEKSAE